MDSPQLSAASPKGTAAGGGKAWSEEEETFLLQKRQEKVAYKKIAAQLNKTELACRLHFHQLQRGSNRRRRNLSMSSSESTSTFTPSMYATAPYSDVSGRRSASPVNASTPPGGELYTRERRSYSPQHSRYNSLTHSPNIFSVRQLDNPADIDFQRLSRLVETHKRHMWNAVATDYGEDVTGEYLENYWNMQQSKNYQRPDLFERKPIGPPTPMISPRREDELQIHRSAGSSPNATLNHPLNQHPRKPTREGRPWELETPMVADVKSRYELFGPELRGPSSLHGLPALVHPASTLIGGPIAETPRYTTERKTSNTSSHSSHRSISVESMITPA